jgi:hypothetical protein
VTHPEEFIDQAFAAAGVDRETYKNIDRESAWEGKSALESDRNHS